MSKKESNKNEKQLAKMISLNREIELLLQEKFEVKGRGLHSYLDAVESKIEFELMKNLRYIASIRNKSIHETILEKDEFIIYERLAKESILTLKKIEIPLNRIISKQKQEILREKNEEKNIFLKHSKYIVFVVVVLLLMVNAKFISVVYTDTFIDTGEKGKEEILIVSEDILDENGEIKEVIKTTELKEINNTI